MLNLLAFSRSPLVIFRFMLLCTFQQSSPVKESRFVLGISLRSSSFKCSIQCKDAWNIMFEELSLSKQRGILCHFPQFIWLLLATVLEKLLKTNLKRGEPNWRRTYWLTFKSKFFPDCYCPSGVWREHFIWASGGCGTLLMGTSAELWKCWGASPVTSTPSNICPWMGLEPQTLHFKIQSPIDWVPTTLWVRQQPIKMTKSIKYILSISTMSVQKSSFLQCWQLTHQHCNWNTVEPDWTYPKQLFLYYNHLICFN